MMLIILGGIGFVVLIDGVKRKKATQHLKVVLGMTITLIFGGAILLLIFEWNNPATLGNMNVGENDLFVQQIATKNNVSVVLSPRAVCTERIWGGWGWWWRRLKLLQTTHRYYPKGALVPTIAELTTRTLFFTAILTALIFMPWEFKMATLVVALLRYFVVMFTMVRNAGRLGETGLAATHFIYDIIEPVLRFILAFSSYKKYKKSWL